MIDICIGNYNTKGYLIKCVESFREHTPIEHNLFVVDNGSKDGSVEWLKSQKDIISIYNPQSIGYGASINQGLKQGNSPFVCIVSADVEVLNGWWEMGNVCIGKFAVVGPKLIFPDGRIGGCGVVGTDEKPILRGWQEEDKGQYDKAEEVLSVCGALFVMRRKIWEELGGFDERFFLYYEETDLFRRARNAGYQILYYPKVKAIHHWNKSPKDDGIDHIELSKKLYQEKWNGKHI